MRVLGLTLLGTIPLATRSYQQNVHVRPQLLNRIYKVLGIAKDANFRQALDGVNHVYMNDIMELDTLERELANEQWSAVLESSVGYFALGSISLHTEL